METRDFGEEWISIYRIHIPHRSDGDSTPYTTYDKFGEIIHIPHRSDGDRAMRLTISKMTSIHIPHRSDGDRSMMNPSVTLYKDSHSTQVRWRLGISDGKSSGHV